MRYSPLLITSLWATLLAVLAAVSGCSNGKGGTPHNDRDSFPAVANVRLGNLERQYTSRDIERCTQQFSPTSGTQTILVVFRNGESGIQMTIGNLRRENGTAELVSGYKQTGDMLIVMGGDERRYHYRLQSLENTLAKCRVNHTIHNGVFRANFQCDRLSNSLKEMYAANGEVSCRLDRWTW